MLKYIFIIFFCILISGCGSVKETTTILCGQYNYAGMNNIKCLDLPISSHDLKSAPTLKNGQYDLSDDYFLSAKGTKFSSEYDYDTTRMLGYIPLNNNFFFLLLIRNVEMEGDGFGQVIDLIKIDNETTEEIEGGILYVGYNKLRYKNFINDEVIKGSFKNIENQETYGGCVKIFNINKNWGVDIMLKCTHSEKLNMNYEEKEKYILSDALRFELQN